MKKHSIIAWLLVLVLCITGCSSESAAETYAAASMAGGKGDYANRVDTQVQYGVEEDALTADYSFNSAALPVQIAAGQKLIRTVSLNVETDDLDALLTGLDARIVALEGYVEYRYIRSGSGDRYRTADLTVRVPAERLDAFVEHVRGAANVVNSSENTDDVTLQYVATQSRITALETEHARLLELLAAAKDMSDLLLIEQRLTDVCAELEEVTSRLRVYDNLVSYSTVRLSATQVQEFTATREPSYGQRILGALRDSWRALAQGAADLLVSLVAALPTLLLLGVAITVVILLIRRRIRRKKHNTPPPAAEE